jgi:hypothetical protein
MPSITLRQLLAVIRESANRYPNATLTRNNVGNLVVDVDGQLIGWIDLSEPEFRLFEEE